MSKTKINLLSMALLVLCQLNSLKVWSQKALRLSFLNQATSLPSLKLTQLPIHPTINIGADFRERGNKHWKRTLGADVYYYYQELAEHAIMLDASYRLGYQFNFGLRLNLQTALGYKHAIVSGDTYKLIDGTYKKANHFGKPQGNMKVGFGLEYPISEKYSIITDYKVMVAGPSGGIFLPASIHTFLGAGLIIKLKK